MAKKKKPSGSEAQKCVVVVVLPFFHYRRKKLKRVHEGLCPGQSELHKVIRTVLATKEAEEFCPVCCLIRIY